LLEVNTASGDSGGPAFIDGKIAGVTVYGDTLNTRFCGLAGFSNQTDNSCGIENSSWGELSFDTRVSSYAGWIDGVMAQSVPEPATWMSLVIGFGFVGWRMRRVPTSELGRRELLPV
jgi:secreted trypsin-like serine protease